MLTFIDGEPLKAGLLLRGPTVFLSMTEYHSEANYNSRRVGVVVVVFVLVTDFRIWIIFKKKLSCKTSKNNLIELIF